MSTYVSETYKGPLKIEVIVVDEVTRAPTAALTLTLALALTLALTLALASSLSLSLSLTRSRGPTRPPSPPDHPHQGVGSAEALRKLTPKLHRLGLGLRLRIKG